MKQLINWKIGEKVCDYPTAGMITIITDVLYIHIFILICLSRNIFLYIKNMFIYKKFEIKLFLVYVYMCYKLLFQNILLYIDNKILNYTINHKDTIIF